METSGTVGLEELKSLIAKSLGQAVLPAGFYCANAPLSTLRKAAAECPLSRLLVEAISHFAAAWEGVDDSNVFVDWYKSYDKHEDVIRIRGRIKGSKGLLFPQLEIFAEKGRSW